MRRHEARLSRRFTATCLLALLAALAVFACDRVTPVAPAGSTITISVNPSRIDATGEAALVTIIVRREDGTPVNPGTQVNISTTLGTLDPEVAFTDETGVAKSNLTGDGRIGMATVSATTGAAALMSVEVQIGSVAASITLNVSQTDVSKDPPPEGEIINLLALVRDDTGAPLGGSTVTFDPEIGSLASGGAAIVTNDSGEARDTLTITRNNLAILSEAFFVVRAETAAEGGALIEDFVEIFIRDVPASITLQVTPSSVAEEGGLLTLSALVRDGLGDPLPGVGANFLTELGTLGEGGTIQTTNAQGQIQDTLSVTEADVTSLGGSLSFLVTVQSAGLAGSLLEDTFQVRKTSCRPTAQFTCALDSAPDRRHIFSWAGLDTTDHTFNWTFVRESTGLQEGPAENLSSVVRQFSVAENYVVTLTVTNNSAGCGVANSRSVLIAAGTTTSCP